MCRPKILLIPSRTICSATPRLLSINYMVKNYYYRSLSALASYGGTAPAFLKLWYLMNMNGQYHTLSFQPWGSSIWYPPDKSIAGPQSWWEEGGKEKNISVRNSNPILIIQSSTPQHGHYIDWAVWFIFM
jgi:hypothetical protein